MHTLEFGEFKSVSNELIVPRALTVFGEALRPVANKVKERMRKPPVRGKWQADAFEFVSRRLQWIENAVERLPRQLNRELESALAENARDADISRAAARVEMHIEQLLNEYDQVQGTRSDARCAMGLALLGDVYRDAIKQVLAWLNEIIKCVAQPRNALRRQCGANEGYVELELRLTLLAPPELKRLVSWAERRDAQAKRQVSESPAQRGVVETGHRDYEIVVHYRPRPDYGMLALVLSAFGLGWVLGGDDGDNE